MSCIQTFYEEADNQRCRQAFMANLPAQPGFQVYLVPDVEHGSSESCRPVDSTCKPLLCVFVCDSLTLYPVQTRVKSH